ncbi:TPA: hypothetical protein ACFNMI_001780 [Neisseria bacilliformis]|jgi:hypothetical protein|nr:MAG TPA: hypothetical protein [Caudoviricetes sp.]
MSLKTDTGQPLTVHTADDGLGLRDVYLDGVLLDRVVFADTAAGVVKVVRTVGGRPVTKRGRFAYDTLRGQVEVVFK